MAYFTSEQRLSIFKTIGESILDEDLSILSEEILLVQSIDEWELLSELQRSFVLQICTHPASPSALTQALYIHTKTPSAAPDLIEIEKMQNEIEQQAQADFQEWIEKETHVEQEYESTKETIQDVQEPVDLPIPLDNDNWDIGFILYHPKEESFYVHFLQSGTVQKVPCIQEKHVEHPNPYLLSVSTKSIFSQSIPKDIFSSFATPIFSNHEYLKRFNKKKKKVFFLQLRQFHSNPVQQIFQCKGNRFQLEVEHQNQSHGLSMRQSQSLFIRSQFGYKQKFEGLTPFIRTSGSQHSFIGKDQQSTGWSLDWIGTHSLSIYAKESTLQSKHLSDGNHSNTITQNLSLCHGDQDTIPISHHKMPYSGMMQTHQGLESLSFTEIAKEESQQRAPQLGKTGSINHHSAVPILNNSACNNQVLLSEQKTILTTTQNNTPFRVQSQQECTHNTHIIIPCNRDKTLDIQMDSIGNMEVSLGAKKYTFSGLSKSRTWTQKMTKTLQNEVHNGWKTSFHEESSSEELHITQTFVYEENGFT